MAPPDTAELIQNLSSPAPAVRRDAAEGLRWIDPPPVEALPALIKALGDEGFILVDVGDFYSGPYDEPYYVADSAESAIARMLDAAKAPLLEALQNGSPQIKARAAKLLAESGEEVTDALLEAVGDEAASVRKSVVESLQIVVNKSMRVTPAPSDPSLERAGRGDWHRSVPLALGERLLDPDKDVVRAAVVALRELVKEPVQAPPRGLSRAITELLEKRPDAVTRLWERLEDPEEFTRLAAAEALGLFPGRRDAAEALAGCIIRDRSSIVTRVAAESLVGIGPVLDQAWLDRLIDVLGEDRLGYPRPPVMEALGSYGARAAAAAPVLLDFVRNGERTVVPDAPLNADVRNAAAASLGKVGDSSYVPKLKELLNSEDEGVYHAALCALRQICPTASEVVSLVAEQLRDRPEERLMVAAASLAPFGPAASTALPDLLPLLHPDHSWQLVNRAAETVAAMGPAAGPAVPLLAALLE